MGIGLRRGRQREQCHHGHMAFGMQGLFQSVASWPIRHRRLDGDVHGQAVDAFEQGGQPGTHLGRQDVAKGTTTTPIFWPRQTARKVMK